MSNYLGNKKLSNLHTKYYYGKLDEGWNICQDDPFYNTAKEELNEYRELRDDSDKILQALCYVYRTSSRVNFDNNLCNFLYYWLGSVLLNKLEKNIFFQEIILNLFKNLTNDKGQVCTAPYQYIHTDDFKKVKLIFDCSEDYKSYSTQYIYHNMYCNNEYKTYFNTHMNIYDKFFGECILEGKENKYCEAFKKYFPDRKQNLLSKWTCELQEIDRRVEEIEEGDETGEEDVQSSPRSGEEEQVATLPRGFTDVRVTDAGIPAARSPYFDGAVSEIGSAATPSNDSTTSITSKSITGAASVAGFLVPSYLMYNYTSAGTWINKVLGRKTRTNFNPYTDQYLMANFPGPENFNTERSRYNISYRPE
ncbi:Plasmodium vivax Vir protein, putative [Plasmodium vivax]|nr:Plasmodium vivax Vir protein, putative [Plasmodium vivax]